MEFRINTPGSAQWDSSMEEVNAPSDEALVAVVSSMENSGGCQTSLLKAPKRKSVGRSIDVDLLDEVRKKLFHVIKY